MKTSMSSGLRIVAAIGLASAGLAALGIVWMRGAFIPAGLLYAGLPLVTAGLVATRIGWAPVAAALVAALYLWEGQHVAPAWAGLQSNPTEILPFMWLDAARLFQTLGSAVALVAAIGAMARRHSPSGQGV